MARSLNVCKPVNCNPELIMARRRYSHAIIVELVWCFYSSGGIVVTIIVWYRREKILPPEPQHSLRICDQNSIFWLVEWCSRPWNLTIRFIPLFLLLYISTASLPHSLAVSAACVWEDVCLSFSSSYNFLKIGSHSYRLPSLSNCFRSRIIFHKLLISFTTHCFSLKKIFKEIQIEISNYVVIKRNITIFF